jgi:CheY-like chemotaxis protein
LKGVRILAAEDNEINQLVLLNLLAGEGARTTLVDNGRRAVAAVEHPDVTFDIVLMDVQMPEMDGLEATRRIRELAPDLPIIGQTAHALAEEHDKCRKAGMNAVVTKPLDIDQLVVVVSQHLGRASEALPADATEQAGINSADNMLPATAIDWLLLEHRLGDRPGFLNKLIGSFLKSNANRPQQIRTAVAANDLSSLLNITHSLKGTAGFLLANEVVTKASTLDAAIKAGSTGVAGSAEALAEALARMLDEIRSRQPDEATVSHSPQSHVSHKWSDARSGGQAAAN